MQLPELLEGRLVRRYKRFLADIELRGLGTVVCHCPNPGSMKNCAPDGARVWVWKSDNSKRKLAYSWELVEVEGAMICVNTMRANAVVTEALEQGRISELRQFDEIRREVKTSEGSRLDFALEGDGQRCYVEVKSVTLGVGDGVSTFPDSVTKRGAKHLGELIRLAKAGDRAVLLFCVGRDDTREVRPADDIDPHYGRELRRAMTQGVEVLAYRTEIRTAEIVLTKRLPVVVPDIADLVR